MREQIAPTVLPQVRSGVVPAEDRAYWRSRIKIGSTRDLAGCWLWKGAKDQAGYGALKVAGTKRNAHRLAYEVFREPLKPGELVCHRCHNPACVNPDHLYAGTRAQSIADANQAGRTVRPKVSPALARRIKRDTRPREVIAQQHGLAVSTVNKIKRGASHRDA